VLVVVLALLPVFWADLGLRRRYFFVPSIGTALMAAAFFHWLAARRAKLAAGLLGLAVAGGALGLVQRNELYRQAGKITRNLVESVRGAALDEPAPASSREQRRIVLLTLPRYLGGDGLSGAYIMHRTDARSALRIAGIEPRDFSIALQCDFAEDYTVVATFEHEGVIDLSVSFRTRRAFESARDRDPKHDRVGRLAWAVRRSQDEDAKLLRYQALLSPVFSRDPGGELYTYSDGRFRRLTRAD
jgi:hypothetical protein